MYDLVLFPPGRLSSTLRSVNRMYWNLQIILKFVFQENTKQHVVAYDHLELIDFNSLEAIRSLFFFFSDFLSF